MGPCFGNQEGFANFPPGSTSLKQKGGDFMIDHGRDPTWKKESTLD